MFMHSCIPCIFLVIYLANTCKYLMDSPLTSPWPVPPLQPDRSSKWQVRRSTNSMEWEDRIVGSHSFAQVACAFSPALFDVCERSARCKWSEERISCLESAENFGLNSRNLGTSELQEVLLAASLHFLVELCSPRIDVWAPTRQGSQALWPEACAITHTTKSYWHCQAQLFQEFSKSTIQQVTHQHITGITYSRGHGRSEYVIFIDTGDKKLCWTWKEDAKSGTNVHMYKVEIAKSVCFWSHVPRSCVPVCQVCLNQRTQGHWAESTGWLGGQLQFDGRNEYTNSQAVSVSWRVELVQQGKNRDFSQSKRMTEDEAGWSTVELFLVQAIGHMLMYFLRGDLRHLNHVDHVDSRLFGHSCSQPVRSTMVLTLQTKWTAHLTFLYLTFFTIFQLHMAFKHQRHHRLFSMFVQCGLQRFWELPNFGMTKLEEPFLGRAWMRRPKKRSTGLFRPRSSDSMVESMTWNIPKLKIVNTQYSVNSFGWVLECCLMCFFAQRGF